MEAAALEHGTRSIRQQVETGLGALSKKQRMVGEFLLAHPTAMLFATATHVAEQAGVDPATVVRFTQSLGFAGYTDFQDALRAESPVLRSALDRLNANAPAGSFSARVVATSACGNSPASNEVALEFPGNTVRVADPDPGTTLGLPDIQGLIGRINSENPGLLFSGSCPTGRKYENNPWQDRMLDRLRQYDTRFGYNGKPTRTAADNNGFPVTAAGDEITFFAGAGTAQGSRAIFAIDILFNHCGPTPELTFRNFTGEEDAFWSGAGRFVGDPRELTIVGQH